MDAYLYWIDWEARWFGPFLVAVTIGFVLLVALATWDILRVEFDRRRFGPKPPPAGRGFPVVFPERAGRVRRVEERRGHECDQPVGAVSEIDGRRLKSNRE